MQFYKKVSLEFLTLLGAAVCLFAILQYAECKKKGQVHHRTRPHEQAHRSSESEEDEDVPPSAPELLGLKGLASAGITYWKPSGSSIPKCLGHDMRLEKIVQVTRYCETATGEGKNDTGVTPRSLCFTACMLKFLGLIGEDLMFTSNIGSVAVDIFPPIAQPQAKRALRHCAKQTVLPLSKADNCTSFGPLKGCILRNAQNICNGEYYR